MKKATLDLLLSRKMQAQNKLVTKDVPIPGLDLIITVKKIPLSRALRILDSYSDNDGIVGKFELYKQLIYESVPLFQDTKLQDAYECAEPSDIVSKVLNDDIQAVGLLGDEICKFYGLNNNDTVQSLKN